MNDKQRSKIGREIETLKDVVDRVEDIKYREEEKLDEIPENLSTGSIYRQIEEAIENLEDALEYINCAINSLEDANTK